MALPNFIYQKTYFQPLSILLAFYRNRKKTFIYFNMNRQFPANSVQVRFINKFLVFRSI